MCEEAWGKCQATWEALHQHSSSAVLRHTYSCGYPGFPEDSGTLYSLLPPIAEVLLECSLMKSPSAEAGKKEPENVHLDKCPESAELNQALPSQDTRALDTLL